MRTFNRVWVDVAILLYVAACDDEVPSPKKHRP